MWQETSGAKQEEGFTCEPWGGFWSRSEGSVCEQSLLLCVGATQQVLGCDGKP